MSMDQTLIRCAQHGEAYAAYVCSHLIADPVQEWFCDYPSEDNPWPDSWCSQCNLEFLKEDGWNERNEFSLAIKLACDHCYESARSRSVNRLKGDGLDAWKDFLANCCGFLHERQQKLSEDYDIGSHKRWDWDQDKGELVFSNDGGPAVIAAIEFVGSISTVSNTWLWSWANFSLSENVRTLMKKVRDFGELQGYPRLTTPKWSGEEVDGWEMTSIAAYVLDALGAYRTPGETGFTFLAITDIRKA